MTKTKIENTVSFTKKQILLSGRYKEQNDLIKVLLKDNKTYTLSEVDQIIEKFMQGEVR